MTIEGGNCVENPLCTYNCLASSLHRDDSSVRSVVDIVVGVFVVVVGHYSISVYASQICKKQKIYCFW